MAGAGKAGKEIGMMLTDVLARTQAGYKIPRAAWVEPGFQWLQRSLCLGPSPTLPPKVAPEPSGLHSLEGELPRSVVQELRCCPWMLSLPLPQMDCCRALTTVPPIVLLWHWKAFSESCTEVATP